LKTITRAGAFRAGRQETGLIVPDHALGVRVREMFAARPLAASVTAAVVGFAVHVRSGAVARVAAGVGYWRVRSGVCRNTVLDRGPGPASVSRSVSSREDGAVRLVRRARRRNTAIWRAL